MTNMVRSNRLIAFVAATSAWIAGCSDPGGDAQRPDADTGDVNSDSIAPPDSGDAPPATEGCDFLGGLQPGSPWPMPGRCPGHVGLASVNGAQTFTKKWSSEIGITGQLVIAADGTLIGGNSSGIVAIGPDGKKKWELAGIGSTYFVTLGADGTTYASSADGKVHAVTAAGGLKWSQPVGNDPGGIVIDTDGTLFVGTADGKLHAVRSDGSLRWSKDVGGVVTTTPALTKDGTLYVTAGKALVAMTTAGDPKWTHPVGGDAKAHPVVARDGTIFAGSNDGKLHAVTPTGAAKWAFTLTPPDVGGELSVVNPVLAPDGTVYVGISVLKGTTERRKVFAVRRDGTEAFNRVDQGVPGAVGADGVVYLVGDAEASRDAIALRPDGSQLWTGKLSFNGLTRAAIGADGTVYFTGGAFAVGP